MSEKMAEEGGAVAAAAADAPRPSGIVKFKDNFVKITKDRKKQIFIGFKSVELLLSFIATSIEFGYSLYFGDGNRAALVPTPDYKNPYTQSSDFNFRIVCVALNGFMIFNVILLVAFLLGDQLPKKLLSIFAIFGAMFCLVAGVILIADTGDSNNIRNNVQSDEMITSGVFAILAALTFAAESVITYKFIS